MAQYPVGGIAATTLTWSPDQVTVGYTTNNVDDGSEIIFSVNAVMKIIDRLDLMQSNEMKMRERHGHARGCDKKGKGLLSTNNWRGNMNQSPLNTKQFDGSKRHVLDWIESIGFLDTVRNWTQGQRFVIAPDASRMPKSWAEPYESRLFDPSSQFLDAANKSILQTWWLAHAGPANIPNWDLIVAATVDGVPALVLVEAKAHASEFDCKPKSKEIRKTPDAQRRTNQNHDRIGEAIDQASGELSSAYPGISISRDHCYQLSNRVAMAWKLASMGIPNTLVFLGFTGDSAIAARGRYFSDEDHWQHAFATYASSSIPPEYLERDLSGGAASFRVIARSLPIERLSRPISERRASPA